MATPTARAAPDETSEEDEVTRPASDEDRDVVATSADVSVVEAAMLTEAESELPMELETAEEASAVEEITESVEVIKLEIDKELASAEAGIEDVVASVVVLELAVAKSGAKDEINATSDVVERGSIVDEAIVELSENTLDEITAVSIGVDSCEC